MITFNKGSRRLGAELPSLILLAILGVLIVLPLLFVALAALTSSAPTLDNLGSASLTLENFSRLADPRTLHAGLNSLLIGLGASALALVIGTALAFLCARTDVAGARFVYFIGMGPLFIPALVGAMAWSYLGGPSAGLINIGLRELGAGFSVNIYSLWGLIFVLAIYYAPYAFLLVHSALSLMNSELEEAALVHGGSLGRMLATVTLPLVTPAALGAGILIFALTVENFPVAEVIATPSGLDTLPTFIYRLMSAAPSRANDAATVAVVLTALLLVVTWVQHRIVSRRSYTTVTGKGVRPRRISLGPWRWPLTIACHLYFLVTVVLPLAALFVTALQTSPYLAKLSDLMNDGALTIDGISAILSATAFHRAVVNSIIVGVMVAVAGSGLSFAMSYVRYRTSTRLGGAIEYLAMAPLAIPAIVLGLGLLWTWLVVPIPIYGTIVVLAVAFLAVFIPQGYRGVSASILQVDRDLEDSAVTLGSGRTRAIAWVTLPLMRVGLTSTFILLLMLAMRELTVALFLYTSQTRLVSIAIFDDIENGAVRDAAATGLLYCVLIFLLAALSKYLGADSSAPDRPDAM